MSGACLTIGAAVLSLAVPDFTLSWRHSVEHTEWREAWSVEADALALRSSAVRGSGAGMEPGPDAVLKDGWWVSEGALRVPALILATSGATGGGWRFCADGACQLLGAEAGPPVALAPCDGTASQSSGPMAD